MKRVLWVTIAIVFAFSVSSVRAEIIIETANLPISPNSGGVTISPYQILGARFHLDSTVEVTAIGGTMAGLEEGTFFGAILSLEDSESLPIGQPINNSEVVASTLFTLSDTQDYRFPLSTRLTKGDYALVFGSGQLGASGGVGMMKWMTTSGTLDFISWTSSWDHWDAGGYSNLRFIVEGTVVPEPATLLLLGMGGLALLRKRK